MKINTDLYTAKLHPQIDDLVQDCGISSALALEIPQSGTKSLKKNSAWQLMIVVS